ncbi:hypothetical protein C5167_037657 [Papaver somniferum]|uniref:Uncharacterized protein n=1 Tax=Papaver somniferum TaxID=3469 RepID=A0A4Y7IBB5_PAPSO|nr:hypothetical protein C5167_037657 [Papaver somniferum]
MQLVECLGYENRKGVVILSGHKRNVLCYGFYISKLRCVRHLYVGDPAPLICWDAWFMNEMMTLTVFDVGFRLLQLFLLDNGMITSCLHMLMTVVELLRREDCLPPSGSIENLQNELVTVAMDTVEHEPGAGN